MKMTTHSKILNKPQYDESFPDSVREKALENILDIRKFEISLYWKRATYFWTFIGATFAGYITLINSKNPNQKGLYSLILLGIIFSLCWYLVNRASKFWQLNWEKHLDVIEDSEIGPLYKTTVSRDHYKHRWYVLYAPYPYSVSKINILLSFFILTLWIVFLFDFIFNNKSCFQINFGNPPNFYGYISLLAFFFIVTLLKYGRTGKGKKDEFKTHINFDQRSISEEESNNEKQG